MGLDVYVGTLTRYLVGDWELATEQFAREAGIELSVVRANPEPEDAITDPDVVRDAVLDWRRAYERELGVEFSWAEADDMPYFTDKPDWSGYFGLLFLAAHDEHPDVPLPDELPEEPTGHPLLERVLGQPKRGLFRRAREPEAERRYFALYGPELWLPVDADATWRGPFLNGEELEMSSIGSLLAQLRDLARRLGADDDELARWRSQDDRPVAGSFEVDGQTFQELGRATLLDEGRFGLAVFLDLAERAVEHRLPVKLDY